MTARDGDVSDIDKLRYFLTGDGVYNLYDKSALGNNRRTNSYVERNSNISRNYNDQIVNINYRVKNKNISQVDQIKSSNNDRSLISREFARERNPQQWSHNFQSNINNNQKDYNNLEHQENNRHTYEGDHDQQTLSKSDLSNHFTINERTGRVQLIKVRC